MPLELSFEWYPCNIQKTGGKFANALKKILHPSHNIRDFEFLFTLFDHSSYLKNLCKYKKGKIMLKVFWIIK